MIVVAALLLLAALGFAAVRTAPPLARFAAWLAVLGFALAAAQPAVVQFEPVPPRTAAVDLPTGSTELLAAAAAAGPRAGDLVLDWRAPLPDAPGSGVLGAAPHLPAAPWSVDPRRVQLRATDGALGRPWLAEIEVPGLAGPAAGELLLQRAGRDVARLPFAIAAGGSAVCEWLPDAVGDLVCTLSVRAGDRRLVGTGALRIAAPPRVLVLDPSGVAAAALRAQGLAVEAVDALPADWRAAQALVLGAPLPASDQLAVVAAAIDGLGLFVLAPAFGGEGAALRALLPLRPQPQPEDPAGAGGPAAAPTPATTPPAAETPPPTPPAGDATGAGPVGGEPIEVDKRAIALVLVVDRSGSMGITLPNGRTKMSYAKTSALRTAQALGAGDQVGVVTFGNKDAGRVELPLHDASDLAVVQQGIERLAHGNEYTYLLGGLRAAAGMLAPSAAAVKHVVVVTDGEFDTGEAVALQDLALRLRRDAGTTVSVISIVDRETDPSFTREAERLTQVGGGQFLPIEDPTFVPVLVSAEVTRALQRVGREPRDAGADPTGPPPPEPPAVPPPAPLPVAPRDRLVVRAVQASPLLLPATEVWPSLGGATAGTAPLDAQVLLVAGPAGWPLLAFGHRGLGRIGAFAADLGGAHGAEFRADPAFPGRFAQWVQAVLPPAPVRAARPLLTEVRVEPALPTARDVDWLTALAGAAPSERAMPPAPALVRTSTDQLPQWALVLLLALVALALVERYAGLWSLRRGSGRP